MKAAVIEDVLPLDWRRRGKRAPCFITGCSRRARYVVTIKRPWPGASVIALCRRCYAQIPSRRIPADALVNKRLDGLSAGQADGSSSTKGE